MSLHYTDSEKGSHVLIFLHYFGGAASSWEDVILHLRDEFRCIAVDLYGFGKSPSPQHRLSVEESSRKVTELIEDLSLANYILIGHSMGAKIAIDVAASQTKGLQSVVLIAPSPPSPEPMKDKDREEMCEAFRKKEMVKKMLRNALGSTVADNVFMREVSNNLSASETAWKSWPELGSKEDISPRMHSVHVPVAILYGEKDKRFTKAFLEKEYSQYFKTFSLTGISDAGHLVPVEAPQKVADEIRRIVS